MYATSLCAQASSIVRIYSLYTTHAYACARKGIATSVYYVCLGVDMEQQKRTNYPRA